MKKIPFIAKITRHTLVKIKMNMKSLMREFIMSEIMFYIAFTHELSEIQNSIQFFNNIPMS